MVVVVLWLSFVCMFSVSSCQHYVYPSAVCTKVESAAKVLLVYQQAPDELMLLLWDPETRKATALPFLDNPVGISLLPDTTGFSFLHEGHIYRYHWDTSTAIPVPLRATLYDIGFVQWFDDTHYYMSAKRRDRYGIFQGDSQGTVVPLAVSITCDCLYPHKINNQLFYIERSSVDNQYHYEVVRTSYPEAHTLAMTTRWEGDTPKAFNDVVAFHEKVTDFLSQASQGKKDSELIIDFGNRPIMFLHMIEENEGFVIEYLASREGEETSSVFFVCHHICKRLVWTYEPLFMWSVPKNLVQVAQEQRLAESLLPLLPRYDSQNHKIYFMDSSFSEWLSVFCYDMKTTSIEEKSVPCVHGHAFSPLLVNNRWLYGGMVVQLPKKGVSVRNGDDTKKEFEIELPYFL